MGRRHLLNHCEAVLQIQHRNYSSFPVHCQPLPAKSLRKAGNLASDGHGSPGDGLEPGYTRPEAAIGGAEGPLSPTKGSEIALGDRGKAEIRMKRRRTVG